MVASLTFFSFFAHVSLRSSADITPRIVAMGFPSEKVEGFYRNPIGEVQRCVAWGSSPVWMRLGR